MNKYTYITVEDVPTIANEKQMYVLYSWNLMEIYERNIMKFAPILEFTPNVGWAFCIFSTV
jgi:hypothetical protein